MVPKTIPLVDILLSIRTVLGDNSTKTDNSSGFGIDVFIYLNSKKGLTIPLTEYSSRGTYEI